MRPYHPPPVTGTAALLKREEWEAPYSDGSETSALGPGAWELGGTQTPSELSVSPQPTPNQVANPSHTRPTPTNDPRLLMNSQYPTEVSPISGSSLRTSYFPISDCVYADQGNDDPSTRTPRSNASNNVWQNTTGFYHYPAQDCFNPVGVGIEHPFSAFVPGFESMPVAPRPPTITGSFPNRPTEPIQRLLFRITEHLALSSPVESRLMRSGIYAHSTSIALRALRAEITGLPPKDPRGVETFCLRRLASASAAILKNFSSAESTEYSPADTIKRLLILMGHMNTICHTSERNPNHLLSNIISAGQVEFIARLLINNPEVGSNELPAHFARSLKEGTHCGLDDVAVQLLNFGSSRLPPNHFAAFAKAVVSASYTKLMSVRQLEYPESHFVSIINNILQALKGIDVRGQATVAMTSRNVDEAALPGRTADVRPGAGEKPTGKSPPDPTYFSSSSASPELPSQTKPTPNPSQAPEAPDSLKCPRCDYIPGPGELGHRRSNLARHKKGHLRIMYQCPRCPRVYSRTDNLRKHWKDKHGENTLELDAGKSRRARS